MVTDAAPGSVAMRILARGHGLADPLATATCGGEADCACDGETCTWKLDELPATDTDWFVAYAESVVDGEKVWALTAPVWLF